MSGESTLAAPAQALDAQYEIMRAAALGEAAPPQARRGLSVLLRQGMWAWARAVARGDAPQGVVAPFTRPVSRFDPPHDGRAVIHLLAAMAMTISDRRRA